MAKIEYGKNRTTVLLIDGVACHPFAIPNDVAGAVIFTEAKEYGRYPQSLQEASKEGVIIFGAGAQNFRVLAKCFMDLADELEVAAKKKADNGD